ncbi:MAG: complexin-2 [Lachnospiraceae bacterium]|nr:complexin-2 [Lachnospiraceae bacterium]
MKNVMFDEKFVNALMQYFFLGDESKENYICRELEKKAKKLAAHAYYSKYRGAETKEEKDQYYKKYLEFRNQ